MSVYARPRGTHYHTTKKCPLLLDELFISWGYVVITWNDVRKRKLRPCSCVKELRR